MLFRCQSLRPGMACGLPALAVVRRAQHPAEGAHGQPFTGWQAGGAHQRLAVGFLESALFPAQPPVGAAQDQALVAHGHAEFVPLEHDLSDQRVAPWAPRSPPARSCLRRPDHRIWPSSPPATSVAASASEGGEEHAVHRDARCRKRRRAAWRKSVGSAQGHDDGHAQAEKDSHRNVSCCSTQGLRWPRWCVMVWRQGLPFIV
jgi:hypothetical protein